MYTIKVGDLFFTGLPGDKTFSNSIKKALVFRDEKSCKLKINRIKLSNSTRFVNCYGKVGVSENINSVVEIFKI